MNQIEDSANITGISGQGQIPISSVNTVPTKTPNMQSIKYVNQSNKYEKNDGLRTQLRRSFDANAGSLPHQHGIQPVTNYEKAKL